MIAIDKISFNFNTGSEDFTRNLYAGWEEFYRDAFEKIVEEYLVQYDVRGGLLHLNSLNLHLGSIPEEDFYHQFPIRLREELDRVFFIEMTHPDTKENLTDQLKRKLKTLEHYLEKGFCPTVWEEAEFDLDRDLKFLLLHAPQIWTQQFHTAFRQSDKFIQEKIDASPGLSTKFLKVAHISRNRMTWLLNATLSIPEKRRYLAHALETEPQVILRFIHETKDEQSIRTLAGLLDKITIWQIIHIECESHVEVDIPPYWMELYNWLLANYPFNGVYIYGNKQQFHDYLNVKLLHFIRKRSGSTYLSKARLTMEFLLEVFGEEYYIEILNVIYNQQARNADGSPMYTGYFNMELYYMFLRLSLLRLPSLPLKEEKSGLFIPESQENESKSIISDGKTLAKWLADTKVSRKEKRAFLKRVVQDQPTLLLNLIYAVMAEGDEQEVQFIVDETEIENSSRWIECLIMLLKDQTIPKLEKRRTLARLLEMHMDELYRIVLTLKFNHLLKDFIEKIHPALVEQLVLRLATKANGQRNALLLPVYQWFLTHDTLFAALIPGGKNGLIEKMLVLLIAWDAEGRISNQTAAGMILSLLTGLVGKEKAREAFCLIRREVMQRLESSLFFKELYSPEFFQQIGHVGQSIPVLLTEALLSYLLNEAGADAKTLSPEEFIRLFVFHLHRACTGKDANREDVQCRKQMETQIAKTDWSTETLASTGGRQVSVKKSDETIAFYRWNETWLSEWLNDPEIAADVKRRVFDLWKGEPPLWLLEFIRSSTDRKMKINLNELAHEPVSISISNAGLVLFCPWFRLLFDRLKLLELDKKTFRDMDAKLRAIFIIQYFVGQDKQEFTEQELVFNRILVDYPFSVPLPKKLELKVEEIELTDSLLKNVKASWEKMQNTSIKAFQQSFIERSGHLEEEVDKWILTVDERSYDILLDSLPWSFHRVCFPWLRKPIDVQWRS